MTVEKYTGQEHRSGDGTRARGTVQTWRGAGRQTARAGRGFEVCKIYLLVLILQTHFFTILHYKIHRRLIRVKMADEGDLLQAIAAMDLLRGFVRDVEGVAGARRQSPATVIRGLE